MKEYQKINTEKIIVEIGRGEWMWELRQRDAHPILMADMWSKASSLFFEREASLPIRFSAYIFACDQNIYVKKDEKQKALNLVRDAVERENYLEYIRKRTLERLDDWSSFVSRAVESQEKGLERGEILMIWKEYLREILKLIPWFYIPWYVTEENMIIDLFQKDLEKYHKETGIRENFHDFLGTLIFPRKNTRFQEEQKSFFKLVAAAKNNDDWQHDDEFIALAEKYLNEYSWMKTFLVLPIEPLNLGELKDKIKKNLEDGSLEKYFEREEKNQKDKDIAHEYIEDITAENKKLAEYISWAQEFGWLLTFSVERALETSAKLIPFFKEIAKTIEVPYEDWVCLTTDEISELLERKESGIISVIEERKKGFVFEMREGEMMITDGEEGVELSKELSTMIGENHSLDEHGLSGRVAMSGRVTGKARIAFRADDSNRLEAGEILVCSMTSPDYLPAMTRSSAIVTDEGGMLSHAAIMSRELRKPCIIGTKNATQILKDGDLIEVDADKGMIKIIERNESI